MDGAVNQTPFPAVDGRLARLAHGLWPARCLVCGERGAGGRDLCRHCQRALPWNHCACPRCALPLAVPAAACWRCLKRPPPLDAVRAAFVYGTPLDRLLPRLKFHDDLAAGRLLAALMLDDPGRPLAAGSDESWNPVATRDSDERWRRLTASVSDDPLRTLTAPAPGQALRPHASPPSADSPRIAAPARDTCPTSTVLIAVPLSRARLRQRGYDQARELARPLARALGLPLLDDALRRLRDTAPQSSLDGLARRRNLRGAFAAAFPAAPPARVLLIDDVMTTGATLHAAATALRRAGVPRVEAWVCARVP